MALRWTAWARLSSSAVLVGSVLCGPSSAQDVVSPAVPTDVQPREALPVPGPSAPPETVPSTPAPAQGSTSTTQNSASGALAREPATTAADNPSSEIPVATESSAVAPGPIHYVLDGVSVQGNSTRTNVIMSFVPFSVGDHFAVDDPAIERIRWRLLGTGWFNDVKLSLARGSRRGRVKLLIEVKERNTLLLDSLVMGLSRSVNSSTTLRDSLRPYAGLGLMETNLFGLGIGVSATAVASAQQYGMDFGYQDPMLLSSGFSLTGRVFHNYAREFFGRNPLVSVSCPSPRPDEQPRPCDPDVEAKRAVVIYHRTGFGIGTGHEISSYLRYRVDWLGEAIDVLSKPQLASTQRGNEIVPIDFHINDRGSVVSSLRFGLIFDQRDHPALTMRGDYVQFYARLGSRILGSSYEFARFEVAARHWVPLPWSHVVSFGVFAGSVFGNPPFFYQFYAADLSDLLPSRVLELNLDRRRTLNLLGTSIVEMDMEDLAARLDVQYQLPLHRGAGFFRGVHAYAGAGVFMLTRREDLRVAIAGYHGLARAPIDLTFDLGVQADTDIGLLKLGFSSLIGFSPLGRENP